MGKNSISKRINEKLSSYVSGIKIHSKQKIKNLMLL